MWISGSLILKSRNQGLLLLQGHPMVNIYSLGVNILCTISGDDLSFSAGLLLPFATLSFWFSFSPEIAALQQKCRSKVAITPSTECPASSHSSLHTPHHHPCLFISISTYFQQPCWGLDKLFYVMKYSEKHCLLQWPGSGWVPLGRTLRSFRVNGCVKEPWAQLRVAYQGQGEAASKEWSEMWKRINNHSSK